MTAVPSALPPRASFLDERAKALATDAVRAFETHTSAELVVTVRKQARGYPEADLASGALLSYLVLIYVLFSPRPFAMALIPLDVAIAFAIGFFLARTTPPLRRLFVSPSKRRAAVVEAAEAAFVRLGVSRTTGRTGLLVYVALLERSVHIVADDGVTEEAARAAEESRAALQAAVARSDVRAFAETIRSLGPKFAPTMKRATDDVNELPDAVG